METISQAHEHKYEARELSEEEKLERAKDYWSERLSGEERILVAQNPACTFCVVVPVHGESRKNPEADPIIGAANN